MSPWKYRIVARVEHNSVMAKLGQRPITLYDVFEVIGTDSLDDTYVSRGKGLFGDHTSLEELVEKSNKADEALLHPILWEDPNRGVLASFPLYNGLLSQYDRVLGCLLGCALGDAIGAPMEAKDQVTCRSYAKECVLQGDYHGIQRNDHPFGQVTDDTQCMRIIAQSFDEEGYFNGSYFAEGLSQWHMGPGLVGYGENTMLAIEDYLSSGKLWYECGRPDPACGNGAAMRASILGVADTRYGSTSSFLNLVEQSCLATHAAPEAILGAQIMAGLARQLTKVNQDTFDPRRVLNRVLITLHPQYGHLDMFQDWFSLSRIFKVSDDKERSRLASKLTSELQPPTNWGGVSPYVRPSVIWSVYSFLAHPEDFTKSIAMAISCGGDVDTTAAMTGSLHGAYNGTAMLDRELLDQLHDRGEWLLADYIVLAKSLLSKINSPASAA